MVEYTKEFSLMCFFRANVLRIRLVHLGEISGLKVKYITLWHVSFGSG
jgi:hypothetical protein